MLMELVHLWSQQKSKEWLLQKYLTNVSAYMTRGHNNSRMITMGAQLVGDELAKNIAKGFVNGKYDGGRHQIRVDMLNKMC